MEKEKPFNPIESLLYIRQRKKLILVSLIIAAVNLVGGELITGENGNSTFILPFGATFEMSRPWMLDVLLLISLVYLLARYVIFSRYVRRLIEKYRQEEYRQYVRRMDPQIKEQNIADVYISVNNTLFFWQYSADREGAYGNRTTIISDEKLPAIKTLLPTLSSEWRLLLNKNSYSDYYSPYLLVLVALISYLFK